MTLDEEIQYLLNNEGNIKLQNASAPARDFSVLCESFSQLKLACHDAQRNDCCNIINETIIRIEIAKTQQSTALHLDEHYLTRFPSGIISDASLSEFWKKITYLDVSDNLLASLPDNIGQCAALEGLDVDNNLLTSLPDTIGQCAALEYLSINNNQLTLLPDTIGQLVALKELLAYDNHLTTLPDNIGQCAALKELYAQGNQLSTLPDAIGECKALQWIDVANNQLTILPASIGQCAALESLYVDNNQLTTLSDNLRQCAALQYLWLTQNKLTELPTDMRDDIFYDEFNRKINKARCLALQKTESLKVEVRIEDFGKAFKGMFTRKVSAEAVAKISSSEAEKTSYKDYLLDKDWKETTIKKYS